MPTIRNKNRYIAGSKSTEGTRTEIFSNNPDTSLGIREPDGPLGPKCT